jgi:hypothetical protein
MDPVVQFPYFASLDCCGIRIFRLLGLVVMVVVKGVGRILSVDDDVVTEDGGEG